MQTLESTGSLTGVGVAFGGDVPLVAVLRGEYVGSLHRGSAIAVTAGGAVVVTVGDAAEGIFLRSAAKPFQVMPAILAGGIDRFGITDRELAVLCASHSGEPKHLEAVLSVLEKIGLNEGYLRCGTHPPLEDTAAAQRWREGQEPSPVCNNCSGAHAGMLVACVTLGLPLGTYGDPDHPLQAQTRDILSAFCGMSAIEIQLAVDNCNVPTFRVPLQRAAQAFARLVTGEGVGRELAGAAQTVCAAMAAHPDMVGGTNRFDTDLMRATEGSIVVKGGAEGVAGVGLREQGLGVAVKITDGAARAVPPVIMHMLGHVADFSHANQRILDEYRRPAVRNRQGDVVGRLVPIFDPTVAS